MKNLFLFFLFFLSVANLCAQVKYKYSPSTKVVSEISGYKNYTTVVIRDVDTKVIRNTERGNYRVYFNINALDKINKYVITIDFGTGKPSKFFFKVAYAYTKEQSPTNVNKKFVAFASDMQNIANLLFTNEDDLRNGEGEFIFLLYSTREEMVFSN